MEIVNLNKLPTSDKILIAEKPLIIYVISDIHCKDGVANDPNAVGAYTKISNSRYRLYYQQQEKIDSFIKQVNADKPNLTLCLGDMFDASVPMSQAVNYWESINTEKYFVAGNHDLEYSDYETLVTNFGNANIIADSKFNRSFYINNEQVNAKFILFDCFMKDSEDSIIRQNSAMGTFTSSVLHWIIEEIQNSTTNNIFICDHCGVLQNYDYFNNNNATAFKIAISALMLQNSNLKIYNLFGHNHRWSATFISGMEPIKSINMPSTAEYYVDKPDSIDTSHFTKLYITNTSVTFKDGDLTYTGENAVLN